MSKFLDTIYKTINKGTIKSHSRCQGIDVSVLKHRHVEINIVEEAVIEIQVGPFVECFELTMHRAGSRYMHWIRLNKTLIKLSKALSDFSSWMFDSNNPFLTFDNLGLKRDIDSLTIRDIKKAYKRISMTLHPDRGGNNDWIRKLGRAKDYLTSILEIKEMEHGYE